MRSKCRGLLGSGYSSSFATWWPKFSTFRVFIVLIGLLGCVNGQLQPPLTVTFTSSSQSVLPNSYVNAYCFTLASQVTYTWYNVASGQVISTGSQLTAVISSSAAGPFRCLATNSAGSAWSPVYAPSVYYVATAAPQSSVVTVAVDWYATIPLNGMSYNGPFGSITWSENSVPIVQGGTINRYVTASGALIVLGTTSTLNGASYSANVTDNFNFNTVQSALVTLAVSGSQSQSTSALTLIVAPTNATVVASVPQQAALATFECVWFALPLSGLSISWYVRQPGSSTGTTIQSGSSSSTFNYVISSSGRRLTLNGYFSVTDAAIYGCTASTGSGSANAEANLFVFTLFSVTTSSTRTANFGSSFTLPCTSIVPFAAGTTPVTVTWYRNATRIATYSSATGSTNFASGASSKYTVSSNTSLVINSIDLTDFTVYQCIAANAAGESTAATYVQVNAAAPSTVGAPNNVSLLSNNASFSISCSFSGVPLPSTFWQVSYTSGTFTNLTSIGRFTVTTTTSAAQLPSTAVIGTTLQVTSPMLNDTGMYSCFATNGVGTTSSNAYVTVSQPTMIVNPPQNQSAVKGSNTQFPCGYVAPSQSVITVNWYVLVNNLQVNVNSSTYSYMTVNQQTGSLTINSVRTTDTGMYMCVVSSSAGSVSSTASLVVLEIPYSPTISLVTPFSSSGNVGATIAWAASFNGNSPLIRYSVYFRSGLSAALAATQPFNLLTSSIPPTANNWTLNSLSAGLTYQFAMTSTNQIGESVLSAASATVTMPEGVPTSPPQAFQAFALTSSRIQLSWSAPNSANINGVLLGYVISYRLSGYSAAYTVYTIISDPTAQSYTVISLIPYTSYECAVAAYNAAGNGTFTSSITVTTLEDVPTYAPTLNSIQLNNSTSLSVSFLPPAAGSINGVLTGYTLYCSASAGAVNQFFAATSSSLNGVQTAVIGGLTPYTNYSVYMTCSTRVGQSPISNTLYTQTFQDLPGPIGSLSASIVLDTSISLTWTPPATPNGLIINYLLIYTDANGVHNSTVSVPASATTYTQSGLQAQTMYTLAMAAVTVIGYGPFNSIQVQTGVTPGPPNSPSNLVVNYVQATQVTLQFVPGVASTSQTVTFWLVQSFNASCGQVSSASCWPLLYSTYAPGVSSFVLPNLTPYTSYTIRLLAQNSVATSSPSNSVLFQTLTAAPSVSPTLIALALNSTAVSLFWQPIGASQWNGPPAGYTIQYTMQALNGTALQSASSVTVSNPSTYSLLLGGLSPCFFYVVQIAAVNSLSYGPYSNITSTFTFDAPPSEAPTNVQVAATSSTTIAVTWVTIPYMQQNGAIIGYVVCYACSASSTVSPDTLLPGCSLSCVTITGSAAASATVSGLYAFTTYSVNVTAYNRMGYGPPSASTSVQTAVDAPGPVSSVALINLTPTSITVYWTQPNVPGCLLNVLSYSVTYTPVQSGQSVGQQVNASYPTNSLVLSNLVSNTAYSITVNAINPSGTGRSYSLLYTGPTGVAPSAPSFLLVNGVPQTTVTSNSITLYLSASSAQSSPVRNYTVQYLITGYLTYSTTYIDASQSSGTLLITGLAANTNYQFQVASTNDFGTSAFSQLGSGVSTQCSTPSIAPSGLQVIPLTTNSLSVNWSPLSTAQWQCTAGSYIVQYSGLGVSSVLVNLQLPYANQSVFASSASSGTLSGLSSQYYTVRIAAQNSIGNGPFSTPITVYAGETVPSTAPTQVNVLQQSVTSTSVTVNWQPLSDSSSLIGYKVYFIGTNLAIGSPSSTTLPPPSGRRKRQASYTSAPANSGSMLVAPSQSSTSVPNLTPYSQYQIIVTALNTAGEGPNSTSVQVQTNQDYPGSPGTPRFYYVTYYSALVVWSPPVSPNGVLVGYTLNWLTSSSTSSQNLNATALSFTVFSLQIGTPYTFTVRAQTQIGIGASSNTSTLSAGPQPGAPGPVQSLTMTETATAFSLSWQPPTTGIVIGYYIEWTLASNSNGASQVWSYFWLMNNSSLSYAVPFSSLLPSSNYLLRVSAFNLASVSTYSYPNGMLTGGYATPSGAPAQPFYTQWWFLVIVALIGVIAVVSVVLLLVLTHRKQTRKPVDEPPRGAVMPSDLGQMNGAYDVNSIRHPSQSTLPYSTSQMRPAQSQSQLNAPIFPSMMPGYGYAQPGQPPVYGGPTNGVPNEVLSGTIPYAAPINTVRRSQMRRTSESRNAGMERFNSDERILADADARSASHRGSKLSLARRRSRSEDRAAAAARTANRPATNAPQPNRATSQPPTRQNSTLKQREDSKRLSDSFSEDSSFDDDEEDSKQPIPSESEKASNIGSLNDIVSPSRSRARDATTSGHFRTPANPSTAGSSRYPIASDTESDVYGSAARQPNGFLYAPFTVVRRSTGPGTRNRQPPSVQQQPQPMASNTGPALPPKPNALRPGKPQPQPPSHSQPGPVGSAVRGPPPAYSSPPLLAQPNAWAGGPSSSNIQAPLNINAPRNNLPPAMQRSPLNNLNQNLDIPSYPTMSASPLSSSHLRGAAAGQPLQDFSAPDANWQRPNNRAPPVPSNSRGNFQMGNAGSSVV